MHCSLRELSRGNASSSLRGAVKQRRWLLLLVLAFRVAHRILAVLEKTGLAPGKSPPWGQCRSVKPYLPSVERPSGR